MCYKPVPGAFQSTLGPGLNPTVKRGSPRAGTGMRVVIPLYTRPVWGSQIEGEQRRLPEVVVDYCLDSFICQIIV